MSFFFRLRKKRVKKSKTPAKTTTTSLRQPHVPVTTTTATTESNGTKLVSCALLYCATVRKHTNLTNGFIRFHCQMTLDSGTNAMCAIIVSYLTPKNNIIPIQIPNPHKFSFTYDDVTDHVGSHLLPRDRAIVAGEHFFLGLPERYGFVRFLGTHSFGQLCEATDFQGAIHQHKRKIAIRNYNMNSHPSHSLASMAREVRLLRFFKEHPNIIDVRNVINSFGGDDREGRNFNSLFVVLDFMPTNLRRVLNSGQRLIERQTQIIFYQIACGLKCIHSANMIHGALRPEHVLIGQDCSVKICDLKSARGVFESSGVGEDSYFAQRPRLMSREDEIHRGLETSYRAPEVELCETNQGEIAKGIDMWSLGCILADLLRCMDEERDFLQAAGTRCYPLFVFGMSYHGTVVDYLRIVFDTIGTPSRDEMTIIEDPVLRRYVMGLSRVERQSFADLFPHAPPIALAVLSRLLSFLPQDRMTVDHVLAHPFLSEFSPCGNAENARFEYDEEIGGRRSGSRSLFRDEIEYYGS